MDGHAQVHQESRPRIKLPGFGLPFNYWGAKKHVSQSYVGVYGWVHPIISIRERCMLALVNKISDKSDWNRDVSNEDIIAQWKQEAKIMDWSDIGIEGGSTTPEMINYCIEELHDKAVLYEQYGWIPVLDVNASILKSDTIISVELRDALKKAVTLLENAVPTAERDWVPDSNGTMQDLIDPSIFPLIFGRTRVLPHGNIALDDCTRFMGKGEVIGDPALSADLQNDSPHPERFELWSRNFQWIPCNISFPDNKNARIETYINNLNPVDHGHLYLLIEQLITKCVPSWNAVLKHWDDHGFQEHSRLRATSRRVIRLTENVLGDNIPEIEEISNDADQESGSEEERHMVKDFEPNQYRGLVYNVNDSFSIKDGFALLESDGKRLQVIVKLTEIHLSSENPRYHGDKWRMNGQLNEHIVASTEYCFASHNIADPQLWFRTSVNEESLVEQIEHNDYEPADVENLFGIHDESPNLQELGFIYCREGRIITYPNGFQHRLGPVELADESQPGQCKIISLYLVDPTIPILSTANVAPQQKHWVQSENASDLAAAQESNFAIDVQEAKDFRDKMFAERERMDKDVERNYATEDFNYEYYFP